MGNWQKIIFMGISENYGQKINYSGPIYQSVTYQNNKATLSFDHSYSLKSIDGKPLKGFEIAGKDGKFYEAKATIVGKKVVVTADQVK